MRENFLFVELLQRVLGGAEVEEIFHRRFSLSRFLAKRERKISDNKMRGERAVTQSQG